MRQAILLFFISYCLWVPAVSYSQDTTVSYAKSGRDLKLVVKLRGKELKTVFKDTKGTIITENVFLDSLATNKYFYNKKGGFPFEIDSVQQTAIFKLQNTFDYFSKNIGFKIGIADYLSGNVSIPLTTKLNNTHYIFYVFSSYCPSCVNRLISLDSLQKNSSIIFLAMMTNSSNSIKRFYKRHKIKILFFTHQESNYTNLPTGLENLPFFLYTDEEGTIIDSFNGDEIGLIRIKEIIAMQKNFAN